MGTTPSARDSAPLYRDRWIECSPTQLVIRGYYFPIGLAKRINYRRIRRVERFEMGPWSGQWRIWGTTSPRYWAHLDPSRPRKTVGLILDLGGFVHPWITPDDPGAVEAVITARRQA
ncbi:MAG TPA: hypothetical protein VLS92_09185 [Acidimicrobiia bacterium]|jgi:hypothetical protein|nr:hypothetical protein [Acidimicrobiia bacterium]